MLQLSALTAALVIIKDHIAEMHVGVGNPHRNLATHINDASIGASASATPTGVYGRDRPPKLPAPPHAGTRFIVTKSP